MECIFSYGVIPRGLFCCSNICLALSLSTFFHHSHFQHTNAFGYILSIDNITHKFNYQFIPGSLFQPNDRKLIFDSTICRCLYNIFDIYSYIQTPLYYICNCFPRFLGFNMNVEVSASILTMECESSFLTLCDHELI